MYLDILLLKFIFNVILTITWINFELIGKEMLFKNLGNINRQILLILHAFILCAICCKDFLLRFELLHYFEQLLEDIWPTLCI